MPTHRGHSYSHLTLGWKVTPTLDPVYWLSAGAKSGGQTDEDLVRVPAAAMGTHTAVVAQSGSGKSYFLGRLIEELVLNTRARCLILDPNADFRKIHQVEPSALWEKAGYVPVERRGRLPHEANREEFAEKWKNVATRIRTGAGLRATATPPYEQLRLWWPSLSMTFLAEDLDPILRSDLYHCHAFVRDLGTLVQIRRWGANEEVNFIDEAQRVFRLARGLLRVDLRAALEQDYSVDRVLRNAKNASIGDGDWIVLADGSLISKSFVKDLAERFVERAATISEYVSPQVERFYFGRAREYQAVGILQATADPHPWGDFEERRLEVVDLPSIKERGTRLLAINAIITTEWERVRSSWEHALDSPYERDARVPTFIVVDEAHNLIPDEPRGKPEASLREQFRTIAAEGRKYGLFLILVTQRPDKLDRLILSECENRAVMKIGSGSLLLLTRQMLGLDDLPPKLLEKCLDFEVGRVLIAGRWAPEGAQILYAGARRTVEGGRSLRDQYWAVVDEHHLRDVPARRTSKATAESKRADAQTADQPTKKRQEKASDESTA